tara:strand:+ start:346 stop:774 length:429 start_codon:yes stop_codon:yes gene_type:complete
MKNLMDKLTTYASLVGVVTAIGGGFYAWGEFNTRLSAIEGVEQATYDLSGISKNAEEIAVINEKIGKLDLSGIAVVEENSKANAKGIEENEEWIEEVEGKVGKNKDLIADVEKKATVNEKTIQLFKLEIEELKLKAKNPLSQ